MTEVFPTITPKASGKKKPEFSKSKQTSDLSETITKFRATLRGPKK